jgi:hypothetical protein
VERAKGLPKTINMRVSMTAIFKIAELQHKEKGDKEGICIGIDVRIEDRKGFFPVSSVCNSYEELAVEVERIKDNLTQVLEKGERLMKGASVEEEFKITPEMSPQEIWSILSKIEEEGFFIKSFNSLGEARRREVAEYVLTRCNVFSGKASVFSGCYDSVSGFMK